HAPRFAPTLAPAPRARGAIAMGALRNRIGSLVTRLAPTPELLRNLAVVVIVLWSLSLFFSCAHANTISIINLDGPGHGSNDPPPLAPGGGQPGSTVGEQRLYTGAAVR